MKTIRKQYTVKILNRIKELQEKQRKANEIGIDLSEFLDIIWNPLEESIAILYSNNDKEFEILLGWVQWWLYENVEKKIWVRGKEINVETAENFTEFLDLNAV